MRKKEKTISARRAARPLGAFFFQVILTYLGTLKYPPAPLCVLVTSLPAKNTKHVTKSDPVAYEDFCAWTLIRNRLKVYVIEVKYLFPIFWSPVAS